MNKITKSCHNGFKDLVKTTSNLTEKIPNRPGKYLYNLLCPSFSIRLGPLIHQRFVCRKFPLLKKFVQFFFHINDKRGTGQNLIYTTKNISMVWGDKKWTVVLYDVSPCLLQFWEKENL